MPGHAGRAAIAGHYAYIPCDASYSLRVYDITDPQHPQMVGSVDLPGYVKSVAISGNYAYWANYGPGLQVIDIADPVSPHIVGSIDTPGISRELSVAGSHAHIADGTAGVQVVDIGIPASPEIVSTAAIPGGAYAGAFGVTVTGNYAYVACVAAGLQLIDITNPLSPWLVGSVDTPAQARSVAVARDFVCVADEDSGIHVFPAQCKRPNAVLVPGLQTGGTTSLEPSSRFALLGASPNPSTGRASVSFEPPSRAEVTLSMHDPAGRRVATIFNGSCDAGRHQVAWEGRTDQGASLPSGVYFIRTEAPGQSTVATRLVVIRPKG